MCPNDRNVDSHGESIVTEQIVESNPACKDGEPGPGLQKLAALDLVSGFTAAQRAIGLRNTIGPVASTPPPRGFDESQPVTPEQLESLPALSHTALHALERCIDLHHVASIDYTDAKGHRSTLLIRPAYIRYNAAHHVVVWGMPSGADGWEELRLDRIQSVRDTGEVFQPTW
jgi:predicted DNA-binding transcriptional regulator YafY